MPFGLKPSIAGGTVDFDAIYHDLIHPAVIVAGLEPVRANDELGRIIHRSMFERLILSEFVLVDLTIANPNVFYELGVRHAVCRASTILIFAEGVTHLPFDVVMIRPIQYRLAPEGIPEPEGVAAAQSALTKRLLEAKSATTDSPLYQMFEDFPNVDKSRSWVFREKAEYIGRMKDRLAKAHFRGAEAVRAVEKELGDIRSQEAGVVVELFLSYRAVSAWSDMIELVGKMTPSLAATPLVREQLALALNRVGRGDEAERLLLSLLADRGPSSETYGILGRVYKDRWQQAAKEGKTDQARDLLNKAIDAYLRGFDMDWRGRLPRDQRINANGAKPAAGPSTP